MTSKTQIKVRSNFDLTKVMKNQKSRITNQVISAIQKEAPQPLIEEIVRTIQSGNSPVSGFKRYEDYSKMYINQMNAGILGDKKPRPINLTLTGEMLASLIAKNIKNGFSLVFNDKKAKWHNDGKGRLPVRKIFPIGSSGEKWKTSVVKPFREILESILNRIIKRR